MRKVTLLCLRIKFSKIEMFKIGLSAAVLLYLMMKFLQKSESQKVPCVDILHLSDLTELLSDKHREGVRYVYTLLKRDEFLAGYQDFGLEIPDDAMYSVFLVECDLNNEQQNVLKVICCKELGIELYTLFQQNNNTVAIIS